MKNTSSLGSTIAFYRRLNALTQEELAGRLGVSPQAVSKWEQQISFPDILLLPLLSETFNISIDELFGKTITTEPVFNLVDSVPWEDDGKIRFAVFHGKKLMNSSDAKIIDGINSISVHFDCGKNYKINGICKLNKE